MKLPVWFAPTVVLLNENPETGLLVVWAGTFTGPVTVPVTFVPAAALKFKALAPDAALFCTVKVKAVEPP